MISSDAATMRSSVRFERFWRGGLRCTSGLATIGDPSVEGLGKSHRKKIEFYF
jgi:hypothetical protein